MDDKLEKFKDWLKVMGMDELKPYQEDLAKIVLSTPPTYIITRRKH